MMNYTIKKLTKKLKFSSTIPSKKKRNDEYIPVINNQQKLNFVKKKYSKTIQIIVRKHARQKGRNNPTLCV